MNPTRCITPDGLEVLLRDPTADDEPYVMSSAMPTVRTGPSYAGLPSRLYHDTVGRRFRELWHDPASVRIVACLEDRPDFIVGYAFGDPRGPVLHHCQVKGDFRRQRVATLLLSWLGISKGTLAAVTFDTMYLRKNIRNGWRLTLVEDV